MPRKVVASTYVTLDGYVDEPGKWSFPFWCDEAAKFKSDELAAAEALLLGGITYDSWFTPSSSATAKSGSSPRSCARR
jgi:hypothetical protein